MLIFVIPAVYPTPDYPQLGIYVQEQCQALRKRYNHQFVILNAPTLNYRQWNRVGKMQEYDDCVGHVYQRYTIGLMQSRLPRVAVVGYKKNILEMFEKAVKTFGLPDLIYAHFTFPSGYVAAEIAKKAGVPFIVDEHYSLYYKHTLNKYIVEITKQTIQNAKGFICVSEALKLAIYNHTGLSAEINVIPNMINDRYIYSPKESKDKVTFFSAGNFYKIKRFDILVEGFIQAFLPSESVELIIAGDGELYADIKRKIEKAERTNQIHLVGRLNSDQMLVAYTNCDCFVLLSENETFGVAYREALSVGRPIISTKNGGIEESWHNEYGILINEKTVECASKALRTMFESHTTYNGKQISDLCRRDCSEEVIAKRINDMFKMIEVEK